VGQNVVTVIYYYDYHHHHHSSSFIITPYYITLSPAVIEHKAPYWQAKPAAFLGDCDATFDLL